MAVEQLPAYTHDCEACVYLGQSESDGRILDHYRCADSLVTDEGPHTCCIARFGNNGPDYASMTLSDRCWDESLAAINGPRQSMYHCYIPALCESWKRWKARSNV
jgi:hypothetical protein